MILDAVDKRVSTASGSGILWFDSCSSLGLFMLSDVCRLMVAIFTGCISNLC